MPSAAPATPTASPSPSPQPSIDGQTSPQAELVIHEIVLDATSDAAAAPRTVTFTSDGPGHVSVLVTSTTMISNTKLCLAVGAAEPVCRTGVAPAFPDEVTSQDHTAWTVTLASADENAPTVDLALSWPAETARVTLSGSLFLGSPNPDAVRSFSASFVPRANGVNALVVWMELTATRPVTVEMER